jgi:transcriptional regulator with XRE-family HTH domain
MDLATRFGSNVRSLRDARGLTQAQLAELADMSSDELSRIERGVREPRFGTIEGISRALGVDPGILFESGEPVAKKPRRETFADAASVRALSPQLRVALLRCAEILARALKR